MLGTRGSHLAKKWKSYLKNISMKFLDKCDREIRLFTFSKFCHHIFPQYTAYNLVYNSIITCRHHALKDEFRS